jgi:DNA-binding MarR family transcriptional regulator
VITLDDDFAEEFPGADPSAVAAAANLVRTGQAMLEEINRHRAGVTSLSPSACQVLAVLDGAGEPLSSTEIADRLVITTASMTSLLDTLERRGLVRRLAHPQDRRKVLVKVTREGQQTIDEVLPVVHTAQTVAMASLSERERSTLIRLLGRVQDHLAEIANEPLPKPAGRVRRSASRPT